MIVSLIPILFIQFSASLKAEPNPATKSNIMLIEPWTNGGNETNTDYDVYSYFLPFLKERNVTRDYNYNYYENDYLNYDTEEKTVDDVTVGNAAVKPVMSQIAARTTRTTHQRKIQPQKVLVKTNITKRAAAMMDRAPTPKKTSLQNLCLLSRTKVSVFKLLFLCQQEDTSKYACVGAQNEIGICKELSNNTYKHTPICIRKEKPYHVVSCNDSTKEFCFLQRNGEDLIVLCEDKRRKVCFFGNGFVEYCHVKTTRSMHRKDIR